MAQPTQALNTRRTKGFRAHLIPTGAHLRAFAARLHAGRGSSRAEPQRRITLVLASLAAVTLVASVALMSVGTWRLRSAPIAESSPFINDPPGTGRVVVPQAAPHAKPQHKSAGSPDAPAKRRPSTNAGAGHAANAATHRSAGGGGTHGQAPTKPGPPESAPVGGGSGTGGSTPPVVVALPHVPEHVAVTVTVDTSRLTGSREYRRFVRAWGRSPLQVVAQPCAHR